MTGTEKQIKWAEDIKANSGAEELVSKLKPEMREAAKEIIESKEAKWWIDHRYAITGHYQELFGLLEKELKAAFGM